MTEEPSSFQAPPQELISGRHYLGYEAGDKSLVNYDVTRDGQKFLMIKGSRDARVIVVLNFDEELKTQDPRRQVNLTGLHSSLTTCSPRRAQSLRA